MSKVFRRLLIFIGFSILLTLFFWWKTHPFEQKMYRFLRVKRWKLHMITAKPEQFDIRKRTIEELLHNMTQAELIHEIIMVLSFVPIVLIHWFGAAAVFIITSIIACLIDFLFVIMQRYNRPRVMRLRKKVIYQTKQRGARSLSQWGSKSSSRFAI